MRKSVLRALALMTALGGTLLVVLHAGCARENTPEAQAPNVGNATTTHATPEADPAPAATPAAPAPVQKPGKAKDRMRYLPATKAAPVFVPNDVNDDDAPPQAGNPAARPQPQTPPQQSGNR